MSRSYKNSRSVVPSWFKRMQRRSQKQKQKQSDRILFEYPDKKPEARFRKSHRWEWF
ncbi:MAG TPA: hypothetical protein VJ951_02325 [Bacteroidales bacterium]|nr:hypothetical protein [Bacteroidales bacterium]